MSGGDSAGTSNGSAEPVRWMREGIAAARNGWGGTHPNPCVGAVIVEGGQIVARGWHERAGGPHAEVNVLRALGRRPAPGAVLVVTLEPCCTCGRTGPCTSAIIEAGIRNVIVGATDPFPVHSGRGFELLRQAGVDVVTGVLATDCDDLNLIFNHRVTHNGDTFVALKTAASLDGRIATASGESQWITGTEARADVMRWRRYFPAIATSSATVLADNPRLTCRRVGEAEWCPQARFIFDRRLRTVAFVDKLHVFNDAFAGRTIVVASAAAPTGAIKILEKRGVRVWQIPAPADGKAGGTADVPSVGEKEPLVAFFKEFKARCAREGLHGVYVEGGGNFLGAWLSSRVADYLFHYVAPKIFANSAAIPAYAGLPVSPLSALPTLRDVRHESFAADFLLRGKLSFSPASA